LAAQPKKKTTKLPKLTILNKGSASKKKIDKNSPLPERMFVPQEVGFVKCI
jgi:hypothetical protein